MSKNQNPGFFFPFFVGGGGGEGVGGGVGVGRVCEQLFSNATHFINLVHITLNFHQAIEYNYLAQEQS